MKTFLRRLEILNFLRSQHTALSTDNIIQHLENSGHLDAQQNQTKSVFRLIQRDLNFLLGEKPGNISEQSNKEQGTYDSFDDYDNDFGLGVEKGSGKSLLWQLSPYQQLNYDFERMPAFMALALTLSEKHLKQVLPSETRAELKKLFANAQEKLVKSEQKLSSRHYQRLSQSVEFFQRGQRLQAAAFNPKILDTIYRAILLAKRISISYQRGQSTKEYELHPYGVVIMLPKLYLVAKKHEVVVNKQETSSEDASFRSFLVHKIQDITIEQHSNHVPDDFDLQHYLDAGHMDVYLSFDDQENHTLLLEITAAQNSNLIEDLKENPLSPDQELQHIHENTWHLSASVKRTIQLKNWLMALGNQAKVLSPKIIQEDLIHAIDAIRSRY
tara:strand:+ start:114117 stop:115271 length:1155 start_codon:yes stop_codon:yes gene_type:complete